METPAFVPEFLVPVVECGDGRELVVDCVTGKRYRMKMYDTEAFDRIAEDYEYEEDEKVYRADSAPLYKCEAQRIFYQVIVMSKRNDARWINLVLLVGGLETATHEKQREFLVRFCNFYQSERANVTAFIRSTLHDNGWM